MNNCFTHAHGWIRPDGTLIQATGPQDLYLALFRDDASLQMHLQISSPHVFLLDLYQRGMVCVARRHDQIVFEHGVGHARDAGTRHQLCKHVTHHGSPCHVINWLYHPDQYSSPARRRVFGLVPSVT